MWRVRFPETAHFVGSCNNWGEKVLLLPQIFAWPGIQKSKYLCMAESTEQTTCIKFKKSFCLLIYWLFFFRVQLIYSDDLLAINSDHQSVAPSQDPLQTKGPLAQLQGQSSRWEEKKLLLNLLSSRTFDSARVYWYCNPSVKISFGIDCEQSLFCSKISESARGIVSVRAAKQWVMRTRIIARERDCSQSTFGKCKKVIALVEYCAIWTFRRFGRQSSRLFRSNPSRQQSSTAVHIEVGYL